MYRINWQNIIGTLAVVATIFQFLSGILVCKQYVRNKTTGEASALPFLFGVLSCSVWYAYGCIMNDNAMRLVNAVGFVLMLAYVVVFYKYSLKKNCLKKQMLGCVVFSIFMLGYLSQEEDYYILQSILGGVACSLTLLTISAPLVKLFYVIQVKSTECLPFYMIQMSFFVSGLWMAYGILHQDPFLIVPNAIGGVLAMCQLCLFMIYPSTPLAPVSGKMFLA